MPELTCFLTTPATAARIFAASPERSTGTPSSLANIARIRSSGRGRLPVWVVRKRLIPYAISSFYTPESPSFARSKLKRSDFASAKHASARIGSAGCLCPLSAHRRRSDECHLGSIRAAGSGYYLLSAEGLLRGDAAVDDEPRAGHEGRVVRGEEHDALGDIVGCAHAADRQSLDDLATRRLDVVGAEIARPRDQHLVAHIGVDCAGVH